MYQEIQESPAQLRVKIKHATGRQKRHLIGVLFLRSFAILAFAIIYISLFITLFGSNNSYVGVASFCLLLSIRFVNYGYRLVDSLVVLSLIMVIFGLNGFLLTEMSPGLAFILNFGSLMVILMLTSAKPEFGNAGVYVFSYILLTSNDLQTQVTSSSRIGSLLLATVFCGAVLVHQHAKADAETSVQQILRQYTWNNPVLLWQLRLALGVALALSLGKILGLPRIMWLGFASMSILLPQKVFVSLRGLLRILGVIIGSIIFAICLKVLPVEFVGMLGPFAGICLGLTGSYLAASVLNCFGALSAAYLLFGVLPASALRIHNNFLGIACGLLVMLIFSVIAAYFQKE